MYVCVCVVWLASVHLELLWFSVRVGVGICAYLLSKILPKNISALAFKLGYIWWPWIESETSIFKVTAGHNVLHVVSMIFIYKRFVWMALKLGYMVTMNRMSLLVTVAEISRSQHNLMCENIAFCNLCPHIPTSISPLVFKF